MVHIYKVNYKYVSAETTSTSTETVFDGQNSQHMSPAQKRILYIYLKYYGLVVKCLFVRVYMTCWTVYVQYISLTGLSQRMFVFLNMLSCCLDLTF